MPITGRVEGSLPAIMDQNLDAVAEGVGAGVGAATTALQTDLRAQVQAAGLGSGLANAWRSQFYPNSTRPLSPAGLVFSKSTVLHDVFIHGATITAQSGRYLAIPTREAIALGYGTTRTSRTGGAVPGGQMRRASQVQQAIAALGDANIRVVSLKGGRKLLVYSPPNARRARSADVALFILVPQVRLRSRIDFDAAQVRAETRLQAEVDTALEGRLS